MARTRSLRPRVKATEALEDDVALRAVLPPARVPRVRGTRVVTAMLPNGRAAWLRVDPAPASAASINRLRRAVVSSDVRQAANQRANALSLRRLAKRVAKDSARITSEQIAGDRKLARKLDGGDRKITDRLVTELGKHKTELRRQHAEDRLISIHQRRRQVWDSIVVASSAPLFAAYGQVGSPLSEHNFTLALNSMVWLLGDELGDLLSASRRERIQTAQRIDFWSYLAPLGNLFTGWWLLGERQHERFVTGVADEFTPVLNVATSTSRIDVVTEVIAIPSQSYSFIRQIDLGPYVANGHIDDLRATENVPAAATLMNPEFEQQVQSFGFRLASIQAFVELGILTIDVRISGTSLSQIPPEPPQPRVAWVVDTGARGRGA